uniref:Secreted protein n=1 Tax=Erpetoichthys calabaricus TaxID=27687 RepID=A0A8C4RM38_ERPCA
MIPSVSVFLLSILFPSDIFQGQAAPIPWGSSNQLVLAHCRPSTSALCRNPSATPQAQTFGQHKPFALMKLKGRFHWLLYKCKAFWGHCSQPKLWMLNCAK